MSREAARQAERLYEAMLRVNQTKDDKTEPGIRLKGSDLVFDPTQSKQERLGKDYKRSGGLTYPGESKRKLYDKNFTKILIKK